MSPAPVAVTHDGIFHADDVFAGAALALAAPGVRIVRTRDPHRIAAADLAFDVGGGAYDHHQAGGNGQRPNGVPYASFGLIWRDYGPAACKAALAGRAADYGAVAAEVDRVLVAAVDAADNGVSLHAGELAFPGARPVGMGTLIGWLRPTDALRSIGATDDDSYRQAQLLAQLVLACAIGHAAEAVAGRALVAEALAAGGPVVVLDAYVPAWQEQVSAHDAPRYCVYPSSGGWRCQAVPASPTDAALRRPLPAPWRALDGQELAEVTGVRDATFCHRSGFICGAATRDGAIALARAALLDWGE